MTVALPIVGASFPSRPVFATESLVLLSKLRVLSARSRCAPKLDLSSSCALLRADRSAAASAYAEALLRSLRSGFGRAPVIFKPGERDVSEDEAWLLRLLISVMTGDRDSATFLTKRRLEPSAIQPILFLAAGLSSRIEML